MSKTILLLTGNERKKQSFEMAIAGFDIKVETDNLWTPEIQSRDNAEVAAYSAQYGANKLNRPVIKMDSGFFIDALNGFPGPFVKYVDTQIGAELFLKLLKDIKNRNANIKHSLAYCEPNGEPIVFNGGCDGTIVEEVRSESGSFIDKLFIANHPNNPQHKTMGEIKDENPVAFQSFWGDTNTQFAKWFVNKK